MIRLNRYQFEQICPKKSVLGQCEWFRQTYGCTLIVHGGPHSYSNTGTYELTFLTEKAETFFRIKYATEINSTRIPSPKSTSWPTLVPLQIKK
jgi:hypothetical protein